MPNDNTSPDKPCKEAKAAANEILDDDFRFNSFEGKKCATIQVIHSACAEYAKEIQAKYEEAKKHMEITDHESLQMEDWLIGNKEFDFKVGLIDRQKLLKERIRDLISKEGEIGDLQQQLSSSEAASAAWKELAHKLVARIPGICDEDIFAIDEFNRLNAGK